LSDARRGNNFHPEFSNSRKPFAFLQKGETIQFNKSVVNKIAQFLERRSAGSETKKFRPKGPDVYLILGGHGRWEQME